MRVARSRARLLLAVILLVATATARPILADSVRGSTGRGVAAATLVGTSSGSFADDDSDSDSDPADDPPSPTDSSVSLSASTYATREGELLTIEVVRDCVVPECPPAAAWVSYRTVSGSAEAGSDFEATAGRLMWVDKERVKSFEVRILHDELTEGDEEFTIELHDPRHTRLGSPSTATVTIEDEDPCPTEVSFERSEVQVGEGDGSATLRVARQCIGPGGSPGAATVDYASMDGTAKAGSDYTSISGALSWGAGELSDKRIEVPIREDDLCEGSEEFRVRLSAPVGTALGSPSEARVEITDNEGDDCDRATEVIVEPGAVTVDEGGGSATLLVRRRCLEPGCSPGAATVDYASVDGTAKAGSDYTSISGPLSWGAGELSDKTIEVAIREDEECEGSEEFTVRLSAPVGTVLGSPSETRVEITDNDCGPCPSEVSFERSEVQVGEGGGSATLRVARQCTGPGDPPGAATVDYASVDGTARAGRDYTSSSGTLSWGAGELGERAIEVAIREDEECEESEEFRVRLSGPVGTALGSPSEARVEITDNEGDDCDRATEVFAEPGSVTVDEGGGSATLVVRRRCLEPGCSPGAATVDYASVDGTAKAGRDYTSISGALSWGAGELSDKRIEVPIREDEECEESERLTVRLSAPVGTALGSPSEVRVEITDNEVDCDSDIPPPQDPAPPPPDFDIPPPENTGEGKNVTIFLRPHCGQPPCSAVELEYRTRDGPEGARGAKAESDYEPKEGTLRWKAGELEPRTVRVKIIGDEEAEQTEFFYVVFSPVPGTTTAATLAGDRRVQVKILDDDSCGVRADGDTEQKGKSGQRIRLQVGVSGGAEGQTLRVLWMIDEHGDGAKLVCPGQKQWDSCISAAENGSAEIEVELGAQPFGVTAKLLESPNGLEDCSLVTFQIVPDNPSDDDAPNRDDPELREVCEQAKIRLRWSPEGDVSLGFMDGQLRNLRHRLRSIWGGVAETTAEHMALIINGEPVPVAVIAAAFEHEREAKDRLARLLAAADADPRNDAAAAPVTNEAHEEEEKSEARRLAFYATGSVAIGDRRDTDEEPGFDIDIENLTLGVDYAIGEGTRWWLGAALGYTSADAALRGDGGEVDVQGQSVKVYGTMYPTETTFVSGIALWGRTEFEIAHNIELDAERRQLRSSPKGDLLALALDAGYELKAGATRLTGFVNTSYLEAEFGRYRESELEGELALEVDPQRATSLVVAVGVDIDHNSRGGFGRRGYLSPKVSLAYLHEFADDSRVISGRLYAGSTAGTPLAVSTARPDRDYFRVRVGLGARFLGGWTAHLGLERDFERSDIEIGLIQASVTIPIG